MTDNIILKVVVGSQAHGLADEKSDTDYRGVFVTPTKELLNLRSVGAKYKANDWFEGEEDNTLYEIGHFLKLATKCNPSILEVFKSPVKVCNKEIKQYEDISTELVDLFPYVWNPKDAFNAFVGYSANQHTKMFKKETPKDRVPKYACAYIRTLYNLECLLETGTFTLDVTHNPELFKKLKDIRAGNFTKGTIADEAEQRIIRCESLRNKCEHKRDLEKVDSFLLKIRERFLNMPYKFYSPDEDYIGGYDEGQ